ncbi:2-phosphosulfolactate phosphatase [Maribellus comscasis]|uniref:Probable 2-phosphosulfolactate phosphatase n=1 Tax=Maribellus comscasis TaxID=2681766 RepID=A0A6I6JWM2_9BACT|nr:2-phosphosulfolactate phosphatase [Maribellus comscasis]QGY44542.1 2-phosphosulfolactate phosphatase [Maribellus comscasis]
MNINILQLLDGAKKARGLTVIIDVFRAFSTACYAFDFGASKIIPVGDINISYLLKEQNPDFILLGERNEQKPPGFDFGNSPSLLVKEKIEGKTLVHTTSSGTQGIVNAKKADEIITGSFVNAGAIVQYIRQQKPRDVSLVCMGYACEYPTDEDTLCAEFIKNELSGISNNYKKMIEIIKKGSGARFFDPEKQDWSPKSDFDLCLNLNRFNFVLKVEKENNVNYLRKIEI